MSIRTITLAAFDTSGSPLSGLSPTWSAYRDATTGDSLTAPAVTALSGGLYKTSVSDDACGIVDFGATASPRYVFVSSVNIASFAAFTSDGVPLAGLTPTWSTCINGLTGASVSAPAIVGLGSGCYSIPTMTATTCGVVSLGGAASPGVIALSVSDGQNSLGPTVENFSPSLGTAVARRGAVAFDVVDTDPGLRLVLVFVRFADGTAELVYDGTSLTKPYVFTSSVAPISNGLRFTLARAGGWPSAPTVVLRAVDASGNLA